MKQMDNNSLIKVGVVVGDIEATAKHYVELFGIEMPQINVPQGEHVPDSTGKTYTLFRGENVGARCKVANIQMGGVTLELLEPIDEPSPYKEFYDKHGNGVLFIGFTINGFEQHIDMLEQNNIPLYLKGEYGSGRYAFFEGLDKLGVNLAIQEMGEK